MLTDSTHFSDSATSRSYSGSGTSTLTMDGPRFGIPAGRIWNSNSYSFMHTMCLIKCHIILLGYRIDKIDELETMATAEHFMATDIEWDPTGRCVASHFGA